VSKDAERLAKLLQIIFEPINNCKSTEELQALLEKEQAKTREERLRDLIPALERLVGEEKQETKSHER